jgi:hypothetical protein
MAVAAAATLAVAPLLRLLGGRPRRSRLRRTSGVAAAVTIASAAPLALLGLCLRRGRRRLLRLLLGWRSGSTLFGGWSTGVGRLHNPQQPLIDFAGHRPRRGGTEYGEANGGGN